MNIMNTALCIACGLESCTRTPPGCLQRLPHYCYQILEKTNKTKIIYIYIDSIDF